MILYCWVVLADKVGRSNNNILPLCKRCRWFECFLTNISVFNEWNSGPFQVQVRVRIADRGIVQRSMWRVQSHPRAGCSSKRSSAHRENPWHRRSSIDREKKKNRRKEKNKGHSGRKKRPMISIVHSGKYHHQPLVAAVVGALFFSRNQLAHLWPMAASQR